jgi:hypothetical protein
MTLHALAPQGDTSIKIEAIIIAIFILINHNRYESTDGANNGVNFSWMGILYHFYNQNCEKAQE